MPTWDVVTPEHVRAAVAEYDRLGQAEFLAAYGFGRATDYLLVVDGRTYDSKAILGVAFKYATGRPLTHDQLHGGKNAAARVLRGLGFRVDGPDDEDDAPPAAPRGTYRAADGVQVPFQQAQAVWVAAAREHLVATAKVYHAVTTYKELAEQVQAGTGVRTRMLMMNWIGGVLGLVAEDCAAAASRSCRRCASTRRAQWARATGRPLPLCAGRRRTTATATRPTNGSRATGTSGRGFPRTAAARR